MIESADHSATNHLLFTYSIYLFKVLEVKCKQQGGNLLDI